MEDFKKSSDGHQVSSSVDTSLRGSFHIGKIQSLGVSFKSPHKVPMIKFKNLN